MDNALEITIKSAEWIASECDKLLDEYKKCRTEHARGRVLQKLQSIRQKMNFEGNILGEIIQKAKDEGFEF